jgi:hypothetical protein
VLNNLEITVTSFDYWMIGSLLTLFLVNTVFQFRLGFSNGAKGGYAVGMYHAVSWLMKNHALECENSKTGEPATPAEVVALIIRSKTYDNFRITDQEEMKKIAEATQDLDK